MTFARTPRESSALSSSRLSRRQCLGLATAGLAAPLLQACGGSDSGGGGGGPGASADAPGSFDPESVRWCREAIQAALGRSGSTTTALSVALLADDRVVWREAFGYANRETRLPVTVDTPFNVGSVAKVLAALSVMILRDRGLLALDQPLVQLLPAFSMGSPGYTRITVRHLISHASGVPGSNMRNAFNFAPIPGYAEDTVETLAGARLKHEPGELAVYCNDGFTLVELLVKQLSGLSYTSFVQREILAPLDMSLSGYSLTAAAEGSFVHPYHKGRRMPQEMCAAFATGGLFSTPTDMLKLARMFIKKGMSEDQRIVSEDAVREMGLDQSPRARINPTAPSWHWGLGWDSVRQAGIDAGGLRCWNKNGGTTFFTSDFFVLPDARLAMMITGLGLDYEPARLAEGLLLRAAKERGLIYALPPALISIVPPAVSPAPDTAALTGVYANHKGPRRVVAASDGSLTMLSWSEEKWAPVQDKLRARRDGYWWADGKADRCYRFETVRGHRYLIQRELPSNKLFWGEGVVGEWLPPLDTPLPAAWQRRVGSRWLCTNDAPESVDAQLGPRDGTIGELPALPGYVLWDNAQLLRVIDDREAGMTVKIPGNDGRDLVELRLEKVTRNGKEQEALHVGSLVFQPA